jgi:hypothetical protein
MELEMNSKQVWLLLLAVMLTINTFAQNTIRGTVTDKKGNPVAFAAVIPDDLTNKGVMTDIDGRFTVDAPRYTLTIRCIGMETLRLSNSDLIQKVSPTKDLQLILEESNHTISEVTIRAGENPADRIMRLVAAHRITNHPERLNTFQCKTYNKVACMALPKADSFQKRIATQDTSKKNNQKAIENFNKLLRQTQEHDVFLMETVTERKFRYPNDNFEYVILNRTSGFQNSTFALLANTVQPFSFYNDFIQVLDKRFVNPAAPSNTKQYFFNIEDTLYNHSDTIFLIAFRPKKGMAFEGLEGVLHINSRGWAVQQVRAKSANPVQIHVKLEQQYTYVPMERDSGHWFPEQLNFELEYDKYPNPLVGLRIAGRSYISDIVLNPPLNQRDFLPESPLLMAEDAHLKTDSAWIPYRQVSPLNAKEWRTYQWMDSFGRKNRLPMIANSLQILSTQLLPINKTWNVNLANCLKINDYEKFRIGIGLTNAVRNQLMRRKKWETDVYAGYGIRDNAWKYGGSLKRRWSQSYELTTQIRYAHDLREAGTYDFLPTGFLNRSFYASTFDSNDEWGVDITARIAKRFFTRLSAQRQVLQPNYSYQFSDNNIIAPQPYTFTETTFYLKYVYDMPNKNLLDEPDLANNRYPIVELIYIKGLKSVLGSDYDYDKYMLSVHQNVSLRRVGRASWRLEAGMIRGNAPIAKLFTTNQGGGGTSFFAVDNTFQTLKDSTLYLTDQFLNFFYKQEIGNILYRHKYSMPFLSVMQNIGYGTLRDSSAHQGIRFTTLTKPILETGFRLDNLILINYLNFWKIGIGAAGFYRWDTANTHKKWYEQLQWRLSTRFNF